MSSTICEDEGTVWCSGIRRGGVCDLGGCGAQRETAFSLLPGPACIAKQRMLLLKMAFESKAVGWFYRDEQLFSVLCKANPGCTPSADHGTTPPTDVQPSPYVPTEMRKYRVGPMVRQRIWSY